MNTSRDELLPCPFCRGDAEMDTNRDYRNISTGNIETGVTVYCTKCSADMMWCRRDFQDHSTEDLMAAGTWILWTTLAHFWKKQP